MALLPIEALRAWRNGAGSARALATGAELSRVLIATGLATPDDIAACVIAQCAAPDVTGHLRRVVDSDLSAIASLAETETLTQVSLALPGSWADGSSCADAVHVAAAEKLLAAGQLEGSEHALARVRWDQTLLRFLALHFDALPSAMRSSIATGVLVRLERWLPLDFHVGALAELAALTRDVLWLDRAEDIVAALPTAELETNPDREHPLVSIARAEAQLGRNERALRRVRALPDDERWAGLVALAEVSPALLASVEIELTSLHEKKDLPWWFLVQPLPGLERAAVTAIDRMPPLEGFHAMCAVAPYVAPERSRALCQRAIAMFEPLSPAHTSRAERVDAWAHLLERLAEGVTRNRPTKSNEGRGFAT